MSDNTSLPIAADCQSTPTANSPPKARLTDCTEHARSGTYQRRTPAQQCRSLRFTFIPRLAGIRHARFPVHVHLCLQFQIVDVHRIPERHDKGWKRLALLRPKLNHAGRSRGRIPSKLALQPRRRSMEPPGLWPRRRRRLRVGANVESPEGEDELTDDN